METDKDRILKKIDEIDKISESQKDRIESYDLIRTELVAFLTTQIQKVATKNDLREKVVDILTDRIGDEENPMSTTQLLRLFEVLSKDENDAVSNILSVIKNDKNQTTPLSPKENAELGFSAKDVDKAKKLMNVMEIIDDIKESEMSIEELENQEDLKNEKI